MRCARCCNLISDKSGLPLTLVQILTKSSYDVVILDLGLPDMHGMDVLRRVQAEIIPDERAKLVLSQVIPHVLHELQSNGSNDTTLAGTAIGWTWLTANSACCHANVSPGASPHKNTPPKEVAAWQMDRNKNHARADGQFSAANTRIKLKRLNRRYER